MVVDRILDRHSESTIPYGEPLHLIGHSLAGPIAPAGSARIIRHGDRHGQQRHILKTTMVVVAGSLMRHIKQFRLKQLGMPDDRLPDACHEAMIELPLDPLRPDQQQAPHAIGHTMWIPAVLEIRFRGVVTAFKPMGHHLTCGKDWGIPTCLAGVEQQYCGRMEGMPRVRMRVHCSGDTVRWP